MTVEQIKILTKMKELVRLGKMKFQTRHDRDYIQDLLDLGLTEEEACNEIMTLNSNLYWVDRKATYLTDGNTLIFKKTINGVRAYIKLKIEIINSEDITVCLSFHKDKNWEKKRRR